MISSGTNTATAAGHVRTSFGSAIIARSASFQSQMIICIDFDGTIVSQDHAYDDVTTPLEFMPGAQEALIALKAAGHVLVLWSARANLALRSDWRLNPLWVSGAVPLDKPQWYAQQALHEARYQQMREFAETELPGIFYAIDDGRQGKFTGASLFIDDKALAFGALGTEWTWEDIADTYGGDASASQDDPPEEV